MNEIKLVCFDVDGTLVDGISWHLLIKGSGCSLEKAFAIFDRARKEEICFYETEKAITTMLQKSGNASENFIRKLFSKVKPRLEAEGLITYLKKKDYPVYLISGAIDIYVEEIAKKLFVDGFYANSSLEFDKKGILKKIHYREDQGGVKLKQLEELTRKLGIKISEVAFVGDSENDIEVFKKTKHGIAVHCTNEELKKVAWREVKSLEEIKRIL